MYSLSTKTFFIIALIGIGFLIFQTSRMNDKEEIIAQQNQMLNSQYMDYSQVPNEYVPQNASTITRDGKKVILTQEEVYLNSKVNGLESKIQTLENQINHLQSENKSLRSQITKVREHKARDIVPDLPTKEEIRENIEKNKATSSKPLESYGYDTKTDNTKESFETVADKQAI